MFFAMFVELLLFEISDMCHYDISLAKIRFGKFNHYFKEDKCSTKYIFEAILVKEKRNVFV